MKRLSKQELKQRDEFVAELEKARDRVCDAVDEYNCKAAELWAPVSEALEKYNGIAADTQSWRDEIVSQMDDYLSERSEKWLEGDAAQAYQEWKDSWESLSIETFDIAQPEGIDLPEIEGPEALRDTESELAA